MSGTRRPEDRLATIRMRLLITLDLAQQEGVDEALVQRLRERVESAFTTGKSRAMADCADFISELEFSSTARAELHQRLREAGVAERTRALSKTDAIARRLLGRAQIRTVTEYRAALEAVDSWVQAGGESAEIAQLNQLLADFESRRRSGGR